MSPTEGDCALWQSGVGRVPVWKPFMAKRTVIFCACPLEKEGFEAWLVAVSERMTLARDNERVSSITLPPLIILAWPRGHVQLPQLLNPSSQSGACFLLFLLFLFFSQSNSSTRPLVYRIACLSLRCPSFHSFHCVHTNILTHISTTETQLSMSWKSTRQQPHFPVMLSV